jgi:pimeloyl-ACP methyl ester carboxylesterase
MGTLVDWARLVEAWHDRCAADGELEVLARGCDIGFGVRSGADVTYFGFTNGAVRPARMVAEPAFTVVAPAEDWALFLEAIPRAPYQNFFGMLMRVPGARVDGDSLSFAQHAHLVRRVLEIAREVASPGEEQRPAAPPRTAPDPDHITGRYRHLDVGGSGVRVFYEESGSGQDLVLLHTAGADARQFHHLMNEPRLRDRCRMVAFDLPWHGRSQPPAGQVPGGYELSTDYYAECVMALVADLGLNQPIILGSSMAGEICLELAYRHPDQLGGVIACEASDHVPGRQVAWARHPQVNQTLFVPEWVDGLMAPQSPQQYRREVWWGYSQGGYGTFFGDILFYSGDWDGRERVPHIDTSRCPVVMLTGEYDYSCTPEMSRRTAERIPGAVFRVMRGLGHFPTAENPPLFTGYLLDALDTIAQRTGSTA